MMDELVPLYVLDTDHVTLLQRGHDQVQRHVLALPADIVVTTVVTVEEQLRGHLKAIRRASGEPLLVAAYDRLWQARS